MSERKPLAVPGDTVYRYDGGLKGFYCCVYECVLSGRLPLGIWPEAEAQTTLLPQQWIDTDPCRAERVRGSVPRKISGEAQTLVETVFLSDLREKELPLLRFLLKGYRAGASIIHRLDDPDVAALHKAERHLLGEAHLLMGFVRFSDHDGRLIAAIRPKNFVLPFIAEHFMERFSCENFMIYDKTHKAALLYENRKGQLVSLEEMPPLTVSPEETRYRDLWKRFYDTVAIASRENPRCRMTHMPKRYWAEMTEMQKFL